MSPRRHELRASVLIGLLSLLSRISLGQAFNIDLDVGTGDPEQGNGAPSSSFGAAASQPGHWNRVQFGTASAPLLDTMGASTSVVMSVDYFGFASGGGFRNKSNTGDFALLLNDALQVGVLSTGGAKEFLFTGLHEGVYHVFTYAVDIAGNAVDTPVYVAGASSNQTQVVTGPMPGNSFAYLVTHSVHEVIVGPEGFSVYVEQPPAGKNAMHINGFQIAPVPEPTPVFTLSLCCLLLLNKKRNSLKLTVSDIP